jgi:hypothetical protein
MKHPNNINIIKPNISDKSNKIVTPDFSFIKDTTSRNNILNAYNAVTKCDAWEFLKKFNPEDVGGCMYCSHPKIYKIYEAMETCTPKISNHSGYSFSRTMTDIQKIAKEGYEKYKIDKLKEIDLL